MKAHLSEQLRDLHSVGRCALANLVAAAPEGDAARHVRVGDVAPHASDPDEVLVGGVERHGVPVVRAYGRAIVHQLDTGRGIKRRMNRLELHRAVELERDALGVRAQHRHAHAGAAHRKLGQMHDLATLVLELHLLGGVALVVEPADLRDQVAHELGRKRARLGNLLAATHGANLRLKLSHAGSTGPRGGLIGRDNHALHAGELVDRPRGHQRDDGCAVGVGDDAVVPRDILGVDLGDDERDLGVHTEGVGVVHHRGARLDGRGQKLLGDGVVRRAEHDVAARKRLGRGLLDHDVLAPEGKRLARRARARQKAQLTYRKILLLEALEHLRAHRTRGAEYRNRVVLHGISLLHRRAADIDCAFEKCIRRESLFIGRQSFDNALETQGARFHAKRPRSILAQPHR